MLLKRYLFSIGIIASLSFIAAYYDEDDYDDDETCGEQIIPKVKPSWEFDKFDKNQDGAFCINV